MGNQSASLWGPLVAVVVATGFIASHVGCQSSAQPESGSAAHSNSAAPSDTAPSSNTHGNSSPATEPSPSTHASTAGANHSTPGPAEPIHGTTLHQFFRLSPKLYSSAAPETDSDFATLQALGITTIVSVDGARPPIELAKKYGIKYVHIPIGYDGMPAEAERLLAKYARTSTEVTLVHCHHGKHRGPTAAAWMAVATHLWTNAQAETFMTQAGTAANYRGLYMQIRECHAPTDADLSSTPAEFPEVAATPSIVNAMVQIDGHFDALSDAQAANWGVPPSHPDIEPAHEALQTLEAFRELGRTLSADQYTPEFFAWLKSAEEHAGRVESALRAKDLAAATAGLAALKSSCGTCHAKYRDAKPK